MLYRHHSGKLLDNNTILYLYIEFTSSREENCMHADLKHDLWRSTGMSWLLFDMVARYSIPGAPLFIPKRVVYQAPQFSTLHLFYLVSYLCYAIGRTHRVRIRDAKECLHLFDLLSRMRGKFVYWDGRRRGGLQTDGTGARRGWGIDRDPPKPF